MARLKISEIKNNPNNPRLIKDDKFKKLVISIQEFPEMLEAREIVVNKDHIILGGNMRFKAAKEAGLKEVPVKIVDWSEDKQRQFVIKDNVSGGEWDWDLIANEWDAEELDAWGLDTPDGWGEDTEVVEDEAPEVSDEPPVSKLGEVYQLGRHRVMCADSTVKENVEKLMNGENINAIVTDPPYGVDWDGDYTRFTSGNSDIDKSGTRKYADIHNDNTSFDPSGWLDYNEVIMWGGNIYSQSLPTGSWLVWDKRASDGSSFLADGEIAWKKGGYGVYIKSINQQSEKSKLRDIKHPTKKPIGLMVWCLEYIKSTDIIDPFLGSGSTLIACEQTDRTCFGMELDEKYVDVIRKRYHKFVTGSEEGWQDATPAI